MRANWSALLEAIPDFHAEILRSAVDGDIVFVEVHWTGTKADGAPLDERGVIVMGIRDDRISWGRLYVDEVEREGADIDAVVRRMAGTRPLAPEASPADSERPSARRSPSDGRRDPRPMQACGGWRARRLELVRAGVRSRQAITPL